MKRILFGFIGLLSGLLLSAQTPYDSFSPETTRPMVEREALFPEVDWQNIVQPTDTILCVAVVDLQRQVVLLVDINNETILGATPLTDEVQKWLSVDPLVDKNIATSPYMYCDGNPLRFVDPDGNSPRDKVAGIVIGVVTNVIPLASLTSLRDAYLPDNFFDYNTSLQAVDNLSQVAGPLLTASGFSDLLHGNSLAMEGAVVTATGVGAPAGGLAVAMGEAFAGTGILKVAAGTILTANAQNNKEYGYYRGTSLNNNTSIQPKSINQLQREVERGNAPTGITRFDKGNPRHNELDHVHFHDGSALYKDGTWKHGHGKLTNEQRTYLKNNGWQID